MNMIDRIYNIMESIDYGFKDESGFNINDNPEKWDKDFYNFYYLLTPEETYSRKCGTCWDQVELERKLFETAGISCKTYFICIYDGENLPSHTFLVYEENGKFYWFEHSWAPYKGIHEYASLKELLLDVKKKFISSNDYVSSSDFTFVYEYQKPDYHISCDEFYSRMEKSNLIKLNEPFYFYHVVSKKANLDNGLISLRYMYEHGMYDLFDLCATKYEDRITDGWNIEKYKGRTNLSREEIIDGLKEFRGEHGDNYIYFFRYPLKKELGPKIEELLKRKNIYRVNINDERFMKHIADIFYGYDMSNSDNDKLTREYYENVTEEEYFSKYDDSLQMNFSTLNHISIAFIDGNCPKEFLERVEE